MKASVERLARALLYEGYILYPYLATALKNRHRWTFGGLMPREYSEAQHGTESWFLQVECLVEAEAAAALSVSLHFLHPLRRTTGTAPAWQEAIERETIVPEIRLDDPGRTLDFAFPGSRTADDEGERVQYGIEGGIAVTIVRLDQSVVKVAVRVENRTPGGAGLARDDAMLRSLASAHVVLGARDGRFVSLLDPPELLRQAAAACRNVGVWPVLVGAPGNLETMLAPPIILDDYPRTAPESPGDFFDGTEIDEMLALRILTLTDEEKRAMAGGDARARALLDRVECLSDERLAALHGTARTEAGYSPGDRVVLRPRGRADAFDILLAGKPATVTAVEEDFEGTIHLAVTVDDDPGRDLGEAGQPGHRFFFRLDEVEPR